MATEKETIDRIIRKRKQIFELYHDVSNKLDEQDSSQIDEAVVDLLWEYYEDNDALNNLLIIYFVREFICKGLVVNEKLVNLLIEITAVERSEMVASRAVEFLSELLSEENPTIFYDN